MSRIKSSGGGGGWDADDLRRDIQNQITKQLQGVRCRVHGKRPTARIKSRSGSRIQWDVKGCCEAVVQEALAKLG